MQELLQKEQEEFDTAMEAFICQWTGEHAAHLLDSDENAGQSMRDWLRSHDERLLTKVGEMVESRKKTNDISRGHDANFTFNAGTYNQALDDLLLTLKGE